MQIPPSYNNTTSFIMDGYNMEIPKDRVIKVPSKRYIALIVKNLVLKFFC
jgi:hypothetical protein